MIIIHSKSEIERMRKAGKAAAELLNYLEPMVKPGVSTGEIDRAAEEWTQERGYRSGPLGYNGFPKSICTSINEVICHGIPDDKRILQDGDIVNVDVSPVVDGFFGDTSRTFAVGNISFKQDKLLRVTREAMMRGIQQVKPGNRLGDIGHAIQTHAEKNGFSVVREFVGHGIGRFFHGPPIVHHFGEPNTGLRLRPGMIFTIEPMINMGAADMKLLEDDWTAITVDGSDSAQFEHTVLVTPTGHEILTLV